MYRHQFSYRLQHFFVCHNRRIASHRVFQNLAVRGKTSVDWFFGFKLHLVVNELGELLKVYVTPGNVDDRQPVPHLLSSLWGKVFADRGYISQLLTEQLRQEKGPIVLCQTSKEYEKSINATS
nr:transposase [Chroococcus sp. FPU101]